MKYIPLLDCILAIHVQKKKTTDSGIYIPNAEDNEVFKIAKIYSVGDSVTDVKPGDFVALDNRFYPTITNDGQDMIFLRNSYVIMKVDIQGCEDDFEAVPVVTEQKG